MFIYYYILKKYNNFNCDKIFLTYNIRLRKYISNTIQPHTVYLHNKWYIRIELSVDLKLYISTTHIRSNAIKNSYRMDVDS